MGFSSYQFIFMYFVFSINLDIINRNMILFTKSIQILLCIVSKHNTAYDIVIRDCRLMFSI